MTAKENICKAIVTHGKKGCKHQMSAVKDLTGQRFGHLVVLERAENTKHGRARWKCRCDCGNTTTVIGFHLIGGTTKGCGCLIVEGLKERSTVHGKYNTRLYHLWGNMKQRCYNQRDRRYNQYGGRGITVCDEWLHDFMAFHDWAMSNGYDESAPFGQCTIDRIDNDKGYRPDNCRWVDMKVQRNNRSDSRSK